MNAAPSSVPPSAEPAATVVLEQQSGYRFSARFDAALPVLMTDEPPPLGEAAGPTPVHLLAAAVGNCLSASLLFALRKFHLAAEPLRAESHAFVGRNENSRLRVQRIAVRITLGAPRAGLERLERVLAQFEDFCTVTQSVRSGIPVEVEVYDAAGERLK